MRLRLTRKLTLESRAMTSDGAGGTTSDWVALGALWASLRTRSAREYVGAGRQASRVSHQAEIRYLPPDDPARPRPDQRFREGERVYAIIGVSEADDRRERLVCWLEEGTSA